MSDILVEQAVFHTIDNDGLHLGARSPQFLDDWIAPCEKLCRGFGRPPEGLACPPALFAHPMKRHHVAVVQVASSANGQPGPLRFHVSVLRADEYAGLGGVPFAVAERCPPNWDATGELPTLTWPRVAFPARTV